MVHDSSRVIVENSDMQPLRGLKDKVLFGRKK